MKEIHPKTTKRVIISKSGKVKKKPVTFVAVLGIHGEPMDPCSGKRARQFLETNRAKIIQQDPFVIQMQEIKS